MDLQIQTSSTSLSSSSSNSGSKKSGEYPEFQHEKKSKKHYHGYKTKSIGFESVKEEIEEKEEPEEKKLPHITMVNDFNEFSQKISHTLARGRKRTAQQKHYDKRQSLSPHGTRGLAKVEEVRGDDDEQQRQLCVSKLGLIQDRNEFNSKNSFRKTKVNHSQVKLNNDHQHLQSIPIMEDFGENIKEKQEQTYQQINSPKYKLKVDEVDFQFDKKWNVDNTQQEVIEEENEEEVAVEEKKLFKKINQLLSEDRDFIKKILKGEIVSEEDILRKSLLQQEFDDKWNRFMSIAEENVINSGSEEEDQSPEKY